MKCPYSWRDKSVVEACADKTFYMRLVDGKPKLKEKHMYYFSQGAESEKSTSA